MNPEISPDAVLEARVKYIYLELKRLGEQPVSVVARRLGVRRTTMYYMLERLEELGIVRSRLAGRMRLYAAQPLKSIVEAMRGQRRDLAEKEAEFRRLCREVEGERREMQNTKCLNACPPQSLTSDVARHLLGQTMAGGQRKYKVRRMRLRGGRRSDRRN